MVIHYWAHVAVMRCIWEGLIRQHGRLLLGALGLTRLCANSWQGKVKWPVGDNPKAPTLHDFSDPGVTATWRNEHDSERW